ncbi:WAP, Kazal, immunoglobulin, Kunitz and NTR domain-containing protein 1 [Spea bombifrons]|uniref:WAP, Kazal, immunoglobulin, Kunitz and NTR domain-containing protein 1 n=1 Tax=Spea bombifrons TaxID=233779 RepID=UPI0023491E40|nr:WAP, Kazal, immunoglobulin, Kunitz and NTR domain-containing protein 1 [Spea bombifrons]
MVLLLWVLVSCLWAPPTSPIPSRGHLGICPNQLNINLWVDAQSTCERECKSDQDCETFEKCCTNVCGQQSCVAARYPESGLPSQGSLHPATCAGHVCAQQGSDCEMWEGRPACRCRERCGNQPGFTCASDGLTYYNRCYMDAEACARGISLTEVPCKFVSSWPLTTPALTETTPQPTQPSTPMEPPLPPALYQAPAPQSVAIGGTVGLQCESSGRPRPEILWEKLDDSPSSPLMRPDQMYGNLVVTNAGQLVIYNARLEDSGIYACVARNSAGLLRARFPLSVVRKSETTTGSPQIQSAPRSECLKLPDRKECPGPRVLQWSYEAQTGECKTFLQRLCPSSSNSFQTYEECVAACQVKPPDPCTLPPVRGPCKTQEWRWAYSVLTRQCFSFIYGGCQGNQNNFESKQACEERCPLPRAKQCQGCHLRGRLVPSLCRSDFVIVGRLEDLGEDRVLRVALGEVLKDEHMGLHLFHTKYLEVTLGDGGGGGCSCSNLTGDTQLLIMGEVHDGMALLGASSYIRPANDKRLRKVREMLDKGTCQMLNRFQD